MKSEKMAQLAFVHGITYMTCADNLCIAHILNKQVVMRRCDVTLKDVVVLFREDAILPDGKEWSGFLGKDKRIRPKRFRGLLSDCLALPISSFPELSHINAVQENIAGTLLHIGDDVSGLLGVTKWEKKLPIKSIKTSNSKRRTRKRINFITKVIDSYIKGIYDSYIKEFYSKQKETAICP